MAGDDDIVILIQNVIIIYKWLVLSTKKKKWLESFHVLNLCSSIND